MNTTLEALKIGLENTQYLNRLRELLTPSDCQLGGEICARYAEDCTLLKEKIALLSRGNVIRTKDYSYECGDGCCYEQGIDVFVDDERLCSVPALEYAIEDLFGHFGVDVDFRHEQ
jgi:hypothetical protein